MLERPFGVFLVFTPLMIKRINKLALTKGGAVEQPIMPKMEIFNPREYLAERVKRGVAFVAVLRSVGSETEACLSNHIREPQPEALEQAVDL